MNLPSNLNFWVSLNPQIALEAIWEDSMAIGHYPHQPLYTTFNLQLQQQFYSTVEAYGIISLHRLVEWTGF